MRLIRIQRTQIKRFCRKISKVYKQFFVQRELIFSISLFFLFSKFYPMITERIITASNVEKEKRKKNSSRLALDDNKRWRDMARVARLEWSTKQLQFKRESRPSSTVLVQIGATLETSPFFSITIQETQPRRLPNSFKRFTL